jgi:hypothetical protein
MKIYEVKRGNVVVKVYERRREKAGRSYNEFMVDDRSTGRRKWWTRSTLAEAKAKAGEIAEAIQKGNVEASRWDSGLRLELRKSLEALAPTEVSILPACQIFAQAVRTLGTPDEILTACQYWKDHRPDRPLTPTSVEEAVEAFKASRKNRISHRRYRTEESYFRKLTKQFPGKMIHEVTVEDVDQLVSAQKWAGKTRNDFITSTVPLFSFAENRLWRNKGTNPFYGVARARQTEPPKEIYEPWEMRQILFCLSTSAPSLVPFFALWAFAGARKEEVSRMTWSQVNRGVTMGYIELQARDTKNGKYRTVAMQDNLKAWLTSFRKETGSILPTFWTETTKSGSPRLDEITRYVTRKTRFAWRDNAPRHSFGTYYFKLCKDPGEVIKTMGTSLKEFESSYWNKSRLVTEDSAREWFGIQPPVAENIVQMKVDDKIAHEGTSNIATG